MRFVLLLLCVPALHAADDRPERVASPELQKRINAAIDKGVAHLKRVQDEDGSWKYPMIGRGGKPVDATDGTGGLTALALYALAASGVPAMDDAIVRGVRWTEKHVGPFRSGGRFSTYSSSLLVLALTRIDARKHEKRIRKLAGRLAKAQLKSNMWTYNLDGTGGGHVMGPLAKGDNSNSQFAILALWAAQTLARAKIPRSTWRRVQSFYGNTQLSEGGWKYSPRVDTPMMGGSKSMTAAGLVSFVYATASLGGGLEKAREQPIAKRGLSALQKGKYNYANYYFAYGLERVGTVLALPPEEWYFEGAESLVRWQHGDGRWAPMGMRAGHGDGKNVYQTSLALLFLSRATRFITITKGERFPDLTQPRTLERAFSYYKDVNATTRATVVHKFGVAGPRAVRLFLDKLADKDVKARETAFELLQALVDKPFFFQPTAEEADRKMMLALIERWWTQHGESLRWDAAAKKFR